jgi:hypothetical protein
MLVALEDSVLVALCPRVPDERLLDKNLVHVNQIHCATTRGEIRGLEGTSEDNDSEENRVAGFDKGLCIKYVQTEVKHSGSVTCDFARKKASLVTIVLFSPSIAVWQTTISTIPTLRQSTNLRTNIRVSDNAYNSCRYQVQFDEGLDNVLVVDGLPIIDESKLERLRTKIVKEFSKKGISIKQDDIFMPWDSSAGKNKGYVVSTELCCASH